MSSSHSSLSSFFHWLFDASQPSSDNDNDDVCIVKDLIKLLRYGLTCFAAIIIKTLLDESPAQALINHIVHTCVHAITTTLGLVSTPIIIISAFFLSIIFLPQIAQLLAPILGKIQKYIQKYFPIHTVKTPIRTKKTIPTKANPSRKLPTTINASPQEPVPTERLDQLTAQINRILVSAMRKLDPDNQKHRENTKVKSPVPIRKNLTSEIADNCLAKIKATLTQRLESIGIPIDIQRIDEAVKEAHLETVMKPNAGEHANKKPPEVRTTTHSKLGIQKAFEELLRTRTSTSSPRPGPRQTTISPTRAIASPVNGQQNTIIGCGSRSI